MKDKFYELFQSKFVRNVTVLVTGTAGAQAITMAFAPIITRIYGPENFGLLGVFLALFTMFSVIAALTYPVAMVLPKKDVDAVEIARLSFITSLIVAIFISVLLFFFGEALLKLFQSESIIDFLILIPVAMVLNAMLQIAQQWMIRKKQFKTFAKVAVINSFILNGAKSGVGLLSPTANALILVTVAGAFLNTFLLAIGVKRNSHAHAAIANNYESKSKRELALEYKDFPIYRAPQVFINTASQSLPLLMFAGLFGTRIAGFYALSVMVLIMPVRLLGKSVADVFYPRISEAANNNEQLTSLVIKATIGLVVIGIVPFGLVIAFGPFLFAFVFGSEWFEAGEFARWLSIWLFTMFITMPLARTLTVIKAQKFHLFFTVYRVSLSMAAIVVAYFIFDSAIAAVISLSIFGALLNIQFSMHAMHLIKQYDRKNY